MSPLYRHAIQSQGELTGIGPTNLSPAIWREQFLRITEGFYEQYDASRAHGHRTHLVGAGNAWRQPCAGRDCVRRFELPDTSVTTEAAVLGLVRQPMALVTFFMM